MVEECVHDEAPDLLQGWRRSMEDAHIAVLDLGNNADTALFGVFDGHGGRFAPLSSIHPSLPSKLVPDLRYSKPVEGRLACKD